MADSHAPALQRPPGSEHAPRGTTDQSTVPEQTFISHQAPGQQPVSQPCTAQGEQHAPQAPLAAAQPGAAAQQGAAPLQPAQQAAQLLAMPGAAAMPEQLMQALARMLPAQAPPQPPAQPAAPVLPEPVQQALAIMTEAGADPEKAKAALASVPAVGKNIEGCACSACPATCALCMLPFRHMNMLPAWPHHYSCRTQGVAAQQQ
jgi:hypothetical protein